MLYGVLVGRFFTTYISIRFCSLSEVGFLNITWRTYSSTATTLSCKLVEGIGCREHQHYSFSSHTMFWIFVTRLLFQVIRNLIIIYFEFIIDTLVRKRNTLELYEQFAEVTKLN